MKRKTIIKPTQLIITLVVDRAKITKINGGDNENKGNKTKKI
jgi:hypothetical protein